MGFSCFFSMVSRDFLPFFFTPSFFAAQARHEAGADGLLIDTQGSGCVGGAGKDGEEWVRTEGLAGKRSLEHLIGHGDWSSYPGFIFWGINIINIHSPTMT